ncbi:MAG: DUF1028 domain-containing protein [Ignavibacteriae bacterium]|nr:DUF1028 domain-containing protein [Ignavibacteria bacterium]MBI3364043.1 DUF1028 domain-containing protein [Ignavibacteriota bacterium]
MKQNRFFGALAVLLVSMTFSSVLWGQDTFSIVAVDTRTKEVGSAGASCIGNSLRISDIIEGVGAIHTQAFYLDSNQHTAHLRMLAGDSPQQIIDYVTTHDAESNPTIRQYGVVDLVDGGRSAGYTGVNTNDYKNHIAGPTYCIQGNILLGPIVLDTMEYAFTHTTGSLADKLMAALLAAKMPGADTRCLAIGHSSQSAFLRVVRVGDGIQQYLFRDVDFDITTDPIDSLKKLYDAWKDSLALNVDPFLSSVTLDKDSIFANGIDSATILISLKNNSNNPLGAGMDFIISNTGAGTVGPFSYLGNGNYVATLRAPLGEGTDTFTVVVIPPNAPAVQILDRPSMTYIVPRARIWTGAIDSLWTNPKNWSPKAVPGSIDTVVIPASVRTPVYDQSGTIDITTLSIAVNTSLIFTKPGATLIIRHTIENHGTIEWRDGNIQLHEGATLINNPSGPAIIGTGSILSEVFTRTILPGSTDIYRFYTPNDFVQFDGSGFYPSTVSMTVHRDSFPTVTGVLRIVPSIVDSIKHTVSTQYLSHFSTWYIGVPSPAGGTIGVKRFYEITDNGQDFHATLSLSYDPSEVFQGVSQSQLQFLVPGEIADTFSYRSFESDSFAFAKDNLGKTGKPVKRGKGMPNAINALDEALQYGGYPGNPVGDSLGGIIIGISHLRLNRGKYQVNPDSAKKYGWIRLGKWDAKKGIGKGYQDVVKTLNAKGAVHDGTPRKFDFIKEQKSMPPTKHNNRLLAEQVALKTNILTSLSSITPDGFGDLVYHDGTVNALNGLTVSEVATVCDSFLTVGMLPPGVSADMLLAVIKSINASFSGPIDTDQFVGGPLELTPVRSLGTVPFLHSSGNSPRIIHRWAVPGENPAVFLLEQNYPNPFNPTTTIQFSLPEQAFVSLKVYNILGQEVKTLIDRELLDEGSQEVEFDASGLSSGVYFYKLTATTMGENDDGQTILGQTHISVKKMILMK